VTRTLQSLGIELPADPNWWMVLTALGIVAAAYLIAWAVGTRLGPPIAAFWAARLGGHGEGMGPRLPAIAGHVVAALLLAIAVEAGRWPPTAAVALGFGLALAVILLARAVLRGVGAPRWAALLVALVLGAFQLSAAVGGYGRIRATLDQIGFDIGTRRISLLSAVTILIIVAALYAGVRIANRVIAHSITRTSRFDATQKLLAQKLAGVAVLGLAVLLGIDLLGIDLTALAVFSGALGLAVGFGLQKTVGNLIAGIILLMDRSIKPGDVIVVGDSFGTVSKIGVRAVSVVTRDGKEHLIPNENLMTQEVENWSYSSRDVRVHIPVGVSYGCDIRQAQELMMQAARECARVLKRPEPSVWLIGFGDSSVDFEILAWISDPESGVGNVRSDVLNRLWLLFQEAGIEIPFPQRDLHLRSVPDGLLRPPPAPSADQPE
jgi:small-conductance mechanosensitive channel